MKQSRFKPELLAPAGNLEKAYVAFHYGADAIYIGGPNWGLRQAAGNFSLEEIKEISLFAKNNNKRVYVVTNVYAYDKDLLEFENYLTLLDSYLISGVIFSDPGIFNIIKKQNYNFEKHLSTQASMLNYETAKFWKELGVSRVVLAREVSIIDANKISQKADIEVEMFLHGAVCMSLSGKCMISNFTADRDANRGGCVQSCRWNYSVSNEIGSETLFEGYPLNSHDLSGINLLDDFFKNRITSLKIEGRMKSNFYIARTVSIYRKAIDMIFDGKKLSFEIRKKIENVSNRGFNEIFLKDDAQSCSVRLDSTKYISREKYLGQVEAVNGKEHLIIIKNSFNTDDNIYFLDQNGDEFRLKEDMFLDFKRESIKRTNPNSVVLVKVDKKFPKFTVLFAKVNR